MMKNTKIGKRLVISFILVAVIASSAGVVSAVVMSSSDDQYSDALVNDGFSQGDLGIAMTLFTDSRRTMRDIMMFRMDEESDYVEAYNEAMARDMQIKEDFDGYFQAVGATITDPAVKQSYDEIVTLLPQYTEVQEKLRTLVEEGTPESLTAAKQMVVQEYDPLYDEIYANMTDVLANKRTKGDTINVQLTEQSQVMMIVVVAIIAAAMGISILLGVVVSRGISRPINVCVDRLKKVLADGDMHSEVTVFDQKDEIGDLSRATTGIVKGVSDIFEDQGRVMSSMAAGDFTPRLESRYDGDFSTLKQSLEKIQSSLTDTLTMISQSADQVSTGSSQVSIGAQNLAQGSTEQASTVQELADTLQSTANDIRDNATTSAQISDKAAAVGQEMTRSNEKMQDMIAAMAQISGSSNEIAKIIKTIEDIAFQTNILALNAAVEAARAGAAGQGFAVVADEVRNLASKSAEASKNTAALIETSVASVESGSSIAGETAQSLLNAVEGAQEIVMRLQDISNNAAKQSAAVEQITQGVEQISAVVQNNSATAEESAAASQELSGQAAMMKEMVGRFKLEDPAKHGWPAALAAYEVEPHDMDGYDDFDGKY